MTVAAINVQLAKITDSSFVSVIRYRQFILHLK